MFNYPNPCDTCKECNGYEGCDRWRMRFLVVWKRFNTYQARQYKKKESMDTKYVYEHPDIVRKYIKDGPCKGCKSELLCDTPCGAYYSWWDARMTALREKYGGGR